MTGSMEHEEVTAVTTYEATCPVCGSRDEYTRPDPVEHTCGHKAPTTGTIRCPRCDLGAPNVCTCLLKCMHDDCAGEQVTMEMLTGPIGGQRFADAMNRPQLDAEIAYATERGWRTAMSEIAVWAEQTAWATKSAEGAAAYRHAASHARERAR